MDIFIRVGKTVNLQYEDIAFKNVHSFSLNNFTPTNVS